MVLWLCSGACVALAAALVSRLAPSERLAAAGLCALFAASALLSPNAYVHDHLRHFLNARAVPRDLMQLLSTWDRPAFMVLYAAPAQLGIPVARLMSLAPATVAVSATMLAARALGLARPWLVGVLVAAQLDFFGQASSTMTELLFAAGLAVAIWGYASEAPWVAAAGLGALSIARPEGPLFAVLGAAGLLARHRRIGPPALSLAPFAAFLFAGAAAYQDLLWYLHQNAYGRPSDGARLRLEWRQLWDSFFYTAMLDSQPFVLLGLEAAGALAAIRRSGRRLLFLLAPLAVSWLLLTFLRIGVDDTWRQSRYLVAMAPALALLAAAGLGWALEAFPDAAPPAILLGAGASAAAAMLDRRRLPIAWGAPAILALFALLAAAGLLLWAVRRRVSLEASLAALLVLPLALSPPGSFARHRPIARERLDLAAVRWLQARTPSPVAVGWDTQALEQACLCELGDPCPLPLHGVSLSHAEAGTVFVKQGDGSGPQPAPPGWHQVWSAEDGDIRGPQLRPRWAPVREVIWERDGQGDRR